VRTVVAATASCLRRLCVGCVFAALLLTTTATAGADDELASARDLYMAAAYEDALTRLNALHAGGRGTADERAIEQYRAFCLLALGRNAEAEQAIEAIILAAPAYRPSEADASPRMRTVFRDARRRTLPKAIEQVYAKAKIALDRKDVPAAAAGFRQVLDLLDDPDVGPAASEPPLSAIRALASEFRDLTAAVAVPPRPPVLRAKPDAPPRTPSTPVAGSTAGAAIPQWPERRLYSTGDSDVVPPVVVRQSWASLADVFAPRPGVVEIVIDEDGTVESAVMRVSVNPVYDRLAIATAKNWRYKPATVRGMPVKYQKLVPLDPRVTR